MKRLLTRKGLFFIITIFAISLMMAQVGQAGIERGKVEKVAQVEGFIEGPVFDKDGTLWFVEIGTGYISRLTPDGKYEKFYDTGHQWGPNGMKMDRNGNLIICHRQLGLIRLDPKTKKVETIVDNYKGKKFNGPNDLIIDSKGNIYFTDPWGTGVKNCTGGVYRVTPEGEITQLFDNLAFPNGVNLSLDEKILYVAECNKNRLLKVWLNEDGTVGANYVMTHFSGGWGPDGMSLDKDGIIYQAHFDSGGVYVVDPMGKILDFIPVPEGTGTTYATFGPDNETLYITESWKNIIYKVKLNTKGHPLYHETWKK